MPGRRQASTSPTLWHRETELVGAYAYGTETLPTARGGARSTSPSTSCATPTSAGWCRPPTRSSRYQRRHRPRRHRRPPRRASRSPSTSATRRRGTADAPPRVRPRRRPLDAADRCSGTARASGSRSCPPGAPASIYPPEPLDAARRPRRRDPPRAAQPARRRDPLPALLVPGMKLTIAFDDISLPLPPMRGPTSASGSSRPCSTWPPTPASTTSHLIAALALHRRMTEAELRHAVGDRVYDAFAPARPALQPRRRGPRQPRLPRHDRRRARRSRSTSGPPRATCSSTSTSTSSHGRRLEVDGHRPGRRTAACATTTTSTRCSTAKSFMDQHHSPSCTRRTGAWARCIARRRRQGLPDRDDAQHRHVPDAVRLPAEARVGVDRRATGPRSSARSEVARRARRRGWRRKIFQSIEAPHQMTERAGRRGRGRARASRTENVLPAAARRGRGPDRHPHDGHARTSARTT